MSDFTYAQQQLLLDVIKATDSGDTEYVLQATEFMLTNLEQAIELGVDEEQQPWDVDENDPPVFEPEYNGPCFTDGMGSCNHPTTVPATQHLTRAAAEVATKWLPFFTKGCLTATEATAFATYKKAIEELEAVFPRE